MRHKTGAFSQFKGALTAISADRNEFGYDCFIELPFGITECMRPTFFNGETQKYATLL